MSLNTVRMASNPGSQLLTKSLYTDGQDHGYAEQSIGWNLDKRFTLAERDKRVILATKFIPSRGMSHLLLVSLLFNLSVRFQKDRHPYRYPDVILEALEGSLERTQMPAVDIYQLEHASRSVIVTPDLHHLHRCLTDFR